jgi:hypothetical protein
MSSQLLSNIDPTHPLSVTQTSKGEVFMANGTMRPQRWNLIDLTVEDAGIQQADDTLVATKDSSGPNISGTYQIAVRYLDDEDIPGDLSLATELVVTSAAQVNYSSIPIPTEPRAVKKQIWRTTAGESNVFYLDVDDLDASVTDSLTTKTDLELQASEFMPLLNPDGTLNARRFGIPPDHKMVVITHQDRTFWGVEAILSDGHCSVTDGSATVELVGGFITDRCVGRKFYIPGNGTEYTIASVTGNNTLTIDPPFAGTSDPISRYEIRFNDEERNRVYFSERGEPESVPSVNAVNLLLDETDNGPVTALIPFGAFLWVTTPGRIYRWTYQVHPINDGNIYLSANRGCLNQRCWVLVDGLVYVMDREGCYRFNGGVPDSISDNIQDFFRDGGGVNWDNQRWFHVEAYQSEQTIKFFVCLDGSPYPKHALCYQYRTGAWWVEEYPWYIGHGDNAHIGSTTKLLVGTTHGRVMLTSSGLFDGPVKALDSRQVPVSVGIMQLTIGGTFTPSDILYCDVVVVSGRGKGQRRRIVRADKSGLLLLSQPWHILPDDGAVIQIGGISWRYKSKTFRILDNESEGSRKVQVGYSVPDQPATMDLVRYLNRAKEPVDYQIDYDRGDGVITVDGRPEVTFDLLQNTDGWVYWSFDDQHDFRGPAPRWEEIAISGVQNKDHLEVHNIVIDGVR